MTYTYIVLLLFQDPVMLVWDLQQSLCNRLMEFNLLIYRHGKCILELSKDVKLWNNVLDIITLTYFLACISIFCIKQRHQIIYYEMQKFRFCIL